MDHVDNITDATTDDTIRSQELLTRAREQDGIDRLWSLTVASALLRERLDRIDSHLLTRLRRGADEHTPAGHTDIVEALGGLAEHLGEAEAGIEEGP